MPDGGSAEDLLNHRLVKKYIARHAESWYRYIRGDRGREVKNGDIRLVIGFDKVSSWGIATFAKNVEERVRLEFKTIDSDQPASRTHIWNCVDGGSGRVGPKEEEMEGLMVPVSESNSSPIKNQTVFVRTLNFNLKGEAWDDLTCHEIRSSDHSSNNSGSRPSQGPSGPSGGQSSSGDEESNSDQGLGNVNFGATQFGLSVCQHFNIIFLFYLMPNFLGLAGCATPVKSDQRLIVEKGENFFGHHIIVASLILVVASFQTYK